MLQKHWGEIAHFSDIELNVDWATYFKMQDGGMLRMFTAREQDGTLVGYAVFIVRYNPHYADSLTALQDVIFIDPGKRGFGKKFIEWCDEQLRKEEVQLVVHHVKAAHNFGQMLESIGYELIDLMYGRRLDIEAAEEDHIGNALAQAATGRTR